MNNECVVRHRRLDPAVENDMPVGCQSKQHGCPLLAHRVIELYSEWCVERIVSAMSRNNVGMGRDLYCLAIPLQQYSQPNVVYLSSCT